LLAVIALPGFQFAIQLEFSFVFISSVYGPLLINIDNSLLMRRCQFMRFQLGSMAKVGKIPK
jgi:hypothetical protein